MGIIKINSINKKRLINIIRGFAVFLMLWGHSVQYCCLDQFDFFNNGIYKFIYSFHMPLFMTISGYLFYSSSIKRELVGLLKHKIKTLVYPIITCSIFNYLITIFLIHIIKLDFYSILNGNWLDSFNTYWFFWSVLASSLVICFVSKINNKFLVILIIIIGFAFVALFPNFNHNIYMFPYFVIGFYVSKFEKKYNKNRKMNVFVGALSVLLFSVMVVFMNKKYLIYITPIISFDKSIVYNIHINMFRWIIGLLGTISSVYLIKAFVCICSKDSLIIYFFEMLGKYSIAVYVLQTSLLEFYLPHLCDFLFRYIMKAEWGEIILIYNFIITPIVATIYAVVILLLIMFLRKRGFYKFLFNRE